MKKTILIVCLALFAALGGTYLYFHDGIQRGLKFPGRVGTAADHYFHDGTQLEPAFVYGELTLDDGVWKYVRASTDGARSYPEWYIIMVQGPERRTYVFEGDTSPFTDTSNLRMLSLFSGVSSDVPSMSSADFEKRLLDYGFRKTTLD